MILPPTFRKCRTCPAVLPDDGWHFQEHKRKNGTVQRDSTCKACNSARQRERYQATMANPMLRERFLAEKRVRDARWQREHPDKVRDRHNRWYRRKVSTPEGRLAVNEAQRITYRLRVERELGRSVKAFPVKNPYTGRRIPVSYLAATMAAARQREMRMANA